jgi:hypothetical protein
MRQALFGILFLSILFLSNCNTHYNDFLQAPPLPDSNTYLLRSDNFNDYNENKVQYITDTLTVMAGDPDKTIDNFAPIDPDNI